MKKVKIAPFRLIMFIFLIFYTVTMLFPFLWGFIASFYDQTQWIMNPLAIPEQWHFENYLLVLQKFSVPVKGEPMYIEMMIFNSLAYAVGCALVNAFVIAVMAYVSAKFDFWFCRILEKIVIIVMIVPIVGSLPSEIQMAKVLNIYDTLWGMLIMRASFLGMYFLVFKAMFQGIPDDYRDAAYLDGAGNYSVFFKIMFPMVMNTFKTIVLLSFVGYWNDYQTPLVYLPSHPTLALGLFYFNNSSENVISIEPVKLAASFTLFIPILILFALTSERLMGNLQMGGLKG